MSTFTTPVTHTAKQLHRCSLCRRLIEAGEQYERQRGYEGADAWTFKMCVHCQALTRVYPEIQDYQWPDQRGYDEEAAHEWASPGNAHDLHEAKAMVGYRMGWRTRGGRLLPIPEPRP